MAKKYVLKLTAEERAELKLLVQKGKAWKERRNAKQIGVDWQFTTADARIKLKHLYPKVKE